MRRSEGISAFSRYTSRVGEPRIPNLCSSFPNETPGSSLSTRNAEMPFWRSPGSRVAKTV